MRLKVLYNHFPRRKLQTSSYAPLGEALQSIILCFNRYLRVESLADRLTGDSWAMLLREC